MSKKQEIVFQRRRSRPPLPAPGAALRGVGRRRINSLTAELFDRIASLG